MKYVLILLLSFLSTQTFALQGGTVGNGGFTITCPYSTEIFSLDYILAKDFYGDRLKAEPAKKTAQSLHRIAQLISQKLPTLDFSFREYVSQINNTKDFSVKYRWEPITLSLPHAEGDVDLPLPGNCRPGRGLGMMISQTIYRKIESRPNGKFQVVYMYDKSTFPVLRPLQASFLYVHEWLWNFSSDLEKNMKLNYFLHSSEFARMSAAQAQLFIKNIE